MELYMVCVLIAIAMSMIIIKGIQCVMSVTHPLPDKELQWRRSPHLPSQELRTVKSKSKKSKNQWKKRQEKMPLAHAEIPLESVFIEEESTGITIERHSDRERVERMERGERVERGDSRATMV